MRQVSLQTLQLLQVFMEDPSQPRYGLELAKRARERGASAVHATGSRHRANAPEARFLASLECDRGG